MAKPRAANIRGLHRVIGAAAADDRSDAVLVQRFADDRDPAAFATLVRRHGPLVWRVCRHVLGHEQDAEDAFQATFLVLARRAGAIHSRASIASWLYGVAFRVAAQARSQERRRRLREQKGQTMPKTDVAAEASWREVQAILHEELGRLSEAYRGPLVLCHLEAQSLDDAARQLGLSVGTLRRRLERGRELLRVRLTRRGVALPAALLASGIGTEAAAVPTSLLAATVKSAAAFAVGGAAGIAVTSERAAALAEGLLRGVAAGKLKVVAVIVLALGAGAGSAGVLWNRQPDSGQVAERSAGLAPAAEQKSDQRPTPRADRYGDPLPEGAVARLGTVRFRHGNGSSVAFAPDGKSILSCGGDRTIRTWDPASGRLLREQQLPTGAWATTSVAILSPDAQTMLLQDADRTGTFYLWDVARHQPRHKLAVVRNSQLHAILFSPDSKTLVASSSDGALKAWDVATGRGWDVGRMKREARSLSFADDGTLVTLSWEGIARFWDVAGSRERSHLTLADSKMGAAISPDGQTIAVWSWHNPGKDKGMEFRDVATGKPAQGWSAPGMKQVHPVHFAPDGKAVFIGTKEGILVWDPVAGKSLRTLAGDRESNLVFSPDGKYVAALGTGVIGNHPTGAVLHVWDLTTGARHPAAAVESGHLAEVQALAFAPDGKIVASLSGAHGGGDSTVRFWDVISSQPLRTLRRTDRVTRHLAFTRDGKDLFIGTSAAILRCEVATGREVGRFPLSEDGRESRQHLLLMQLTSDGRTLLALSQIMDGKGPEPAGNSCGLHAWDVATGKRSRATAFFPYDHSIGYSQFAPDGRLLALPAGSIRDAATGKELWRLTAEGNLSLEFPVVFSPDGSLIASSLHEILKGPGWQRVEGRGVQVWELPTLLPVVRLQTGALGQAHLAFTPDSRRLIAAGPDALTLWDLASGRAVARRPAPGRFRGSYGPSFASCLALTLDGRTLATGQTDTTVLLWDLAPPAAAQTPAPLANTELQACWDELAGADAGRALRAMSRLADRPGQAVELLRERVRPAQAPADEDLRRLLADLNDDRFPTREAAGKRLAELGELADRALRDSLVRQPTLEARRRIEGLLSEPRLVRAPEVRRQLRAVRLVEWIGTVDTQQLLQTLARGAPGARLTTDAKASLERLAPRPTSHP